MNYKQIPSSIKVGGQTIKIKNVERVDDDDCGEAYLAAGYIEIADKLSKNYEQSETSKINTFYHEMTHIILKTMGEYELNKNEKFVCCFAGFLTDALEKAVFIEED